jgi:hypothetical protein
MRIWILVIFLSACLAAFFFNPLLGLALIPSVLLSYWIWKDGMDIEDLSKEIEVLRRRIGEIEGRLA